MHLTPVHQLRKDTYTHTHHEHTHLEQWAANVAARGEQLGVQCLAQGNLSRGIEGGETTNNSCWT